MSGSFIKKLQAVREAGYWLFERNEIEGKLKLLQVSHEF